MGYYDPDKDYSIAIEEAKSSGASQSYIDQLMEERENKIEDKYGGNEPTMWGSDKTYSDAVDNGDSDSISSALDYHYNNYGATDPWSKYAGTNYHQDAIYAAQRGDWDSVVNYLSQREDKTAAQGDNRGKTSAEIYAELWDLYGTKKPVAAAGGGGGFNYGVSKPAFNSDYADRIDALLNQVLNREDFSYTAVDDPLYQQYKSMYNREGTRAMNDTLAAAAADAGGMNSYAITAAQQANNYYNAQLGDKIPELYQLAYEMYLQDIDNQVRDLGLLQSMDDTQYGRYRDTMSDWYNDRDFAYGQYRDDVADGQWQQSFDHSVSQDAIDNAFRQSQFDWTVSTDKRDYDYTVGRDTIEDAWRNEEWQHQLEQDDLAASQWNQAFDLEKQQYNDSLIGYTPTGNTGSKGETNRDDGKTWNPDNGDDKTESSGSGWDNEGLSDSQIREMQKYFGAGVDGRWGSESRSKAGNKSAKAAWDYYQIAKKMDGVTIQGKPFQEYEAAAGNYADVVSIIKQMEADGRPKSDILAALREAYQTGVLNQTDYSNLYNKYRG